MDGQIKGRHLKQVRSDEQQQQRGEGFRDSGRVCVHMRERSVLASRASLIFPPQTL